jgi:hypothetical protein
MGYTGAMSLSSRLWWVLLGVVVIAAAAYFVWGAGGQQSLPVQTQGIHALFACAGGKTADATFYRGSSVPPAQAGMPPTPTGSVHLVLSDGRDMILPQTLSADGGRYANSDESIVFWNKGNGAFIQENGTTTFANCVTNG